MKAGIATFFFFLLISPQSIPQEAGVLNRTDNSGMKQGHWIKKYPDGSIMYDGFFRNDKPEGEFKRFYEDQTLKSVLVFYHAGTEADATLYYQNGLVASTGKYVNQLKEGVWKFFSFSNDGVLIADEIYKKDKKNGPSRKFYSDGTVAEVINYTNGARNGEWTKYYPDGSIYFRTGCVSGKLDGIFEAYFENGKTEISGQYRNDLREGRWIIYNENGSPRFNIEYSLGIPKNRTFEIYQSDYIDSLEKNMLKIPDPEKTGEIW